MVFILYNSCAVEVSQAEEVPTVLDFFYANYLGGESQASDDYT